MTTKKHASRSKLLTGFTLIEVIVSVAVLMILFLVMVEGFVLLPKKSDLRNSAEEITSILRLAQSKTVSSNLNSRYGVYFNNTVFPNSYTLFKGSDYASRDVLADKVYFLPSAVEFFSIDFQGGSEVVFNRLTGFADNWGSVSVELTEDASSNKSVYVNNLGVVGFVQPPLASDAARVKDTRHVHVDYGRSIDTFTESVTLNFNNGEVVQVIPIAANMAGGQFTWEGTVIAAGQDQTIKIHTHLLNSASPPYTQFSIHRDMRLNTAPLKITVSGETIAEYPADGLSVTYGSFYVSGIEWQ